MASEHPSDKPAAGERKPPRERRPSPQPPPQIKPPLSNDGPELVRDIHT